MRRVHLVSVGLLLGALSAVSVTNSYAEDKAQPSKPSPQAFVKKDAAKEFACPEDKLLMKEQDAEKDKGNIAYEVSGCGKTVRYLFPALGSVQTEQNAGTVLQMSTSRCPEGQTWQCTKVEKRCEMYCSGPPSEGSNCTWKVRCWRECTEYDCR